MLRAPLIFIALQIGLVACGARTEDAVVRSRAVFSTDGAESEADDPHPLVVFELDRSQFKVPSKIVNGKVDLGSVKISRLEDSNLSVCGTNRRTRCNFAVIRIYTTDAKGEGIWNAADGYGAPLFTSLKGGSVLPVGLEVAGAATLAKVDIRGVDSIVLPPNYQPEPRFYFTADFTGAGYGEYKTNIVIEYLLTL